MINYAHVIVDLQAGDTGKGKVASSLLKRGTYTHVIRYNGGGNAGHTIYVDDKMIVTHFIPCGVLHGIKSIIGPGCVVNPFKLKSEIEELEKLGFDVKNNLFIDKRTHVITTLHVNEDLTDTKIGTTKTGNGPAYRDKFARVGVRAENFDDLKDMVIDIYEELHGQEHVKILFEGAQGFELDIDWGDYPYVTSSHCTVGSAILNGVPPQKIQKVFGTAKAYRTYVGNKPFEKNCEQFDKIREKGNEFGATTGRKRQIDWLNLDDLIKAININGVTDLIINKSDILFEIGEYSFYNNGVLNKFTDFESFKRNIQQIIYNKCQSVGDIIFSLSPYEI